jgi:CRISPR-associated protein Cmr6
MSWLKTNDLTLQRDANWHLWKLNQIPIRIDKLREVALTWMRLQGFEPKIHTSWRESWHPDSVQVWGRIADRADDSVAILWFHENSNNHPSIKYTLAGQMNQIGRIWHRMYPVIALKKNEVDSLKPIVTKQNQFIELFTVFPDLNIPQCQPFIKFLQEDQNDFTKLWGSSI